MTTSYRDLQEAFIQSRGRPVEAAGQTVVQMDEIGLTGVSEVKVKFIGGATYKDNGVVIAIKPPGKIILSNGKAENAVQIWDEPGLPRFAVHFVHPAGKLLQVYNKYRVRHDAWFVTEDSFTGNAGMIVTHLSANSRRYECSSGLGDFSPTDLIFELTWNLIK